MQGQRHAAHVLAFIYTHGEIPRDENGKRYHIDHECHNDDVNCPGGVVCMHRRCCNPAHLKAKLGRENNEAANEPHKRGHYKERCAKDHPFDEENTGWMPPRRPGERKRRYCKQCNRDNARRQKEKRQA